MRTVAIEQSEDYFTEKFKHFCFDECPNNHHCLAEKCFLRECVWALCDYPEDPQIRPEERALQTINGMARSSQIGLTTAETITDALKARMMSGVYYIDSIPYCPNCHQAVGLDAKFCEHCGQKLED